MKFIAIKNGKSIIGGAVLTIFPGRIKSADITSGPLIDYSNKELVHFFTSSLRDYLKTLDVIYVTISPYITYNPEILKLLKSCGWSYSGRINKTAVGIRGNIRWIFKKDLAGLSVENYRDGYAKRHRRYVKSTEKNLKIEQITRDKLPEFLKIMQHTAERREFRNRDDKYFYAIYDSFGDKAHFLVARLSDNTPVAGILFIESNGEIVSFLGGAEEKYADERGTYLLHDYMIKQSVEKGYKYYNFYGIEGDLENPKSEGYGIYVFKSRFGGGVPVELIGEFVLPVDKLKFKAMNTVKKAKKLLKR